ncbi:LIM domain transcription factor lmo4.2 [Plakobranchus ocellatus]|uniref:LIM domain transcription factor lmo4.2 n=1 Tax=Plakobranchus ocellatus TaxID=259542 RepID=A0AAV4A5N7_9GAST|nr:LIM domain transcription factor lmo4.2 [Plakobranchus ocellatus]
MKDTSSFCVLFGSSGSCCGCGQPIPASELVMRAQTSVYHLKCFTCCTCHSPLNTGDRYGIVQGSLVCEQDFPKVVKGLTPLPNRTSHKTKTTAKRKPLPQPIDLAHFVSAMRLRHQTKIEVRMR